jgi:hypothetical protein
MEKCGVVDGKRRGVITGRPTKIKIPSNLCDLKKKIYQHQILRTFGSIYVNLFLSDAFRYISVYYRPGLSKLMFLFFSVVRNRLREYLRD